MASPFSDYPAVIRHLETRLLVADLKDILKDLNLSCSGNKKPLIDRVKSHLSLLKASNDVSRYTSVKNKITRYGSSSSIPSALPSRASYPGSQAALAQSSPVRVPYTQYMNSSRSFGNTNHAPQQLLNFKPSPFYEVVERLSNSATLPYSGRNTVSMSFVCSAMSLDLLLRHPTKYKVGLMCADSTYSYDSSRKLLLEFPNPSEILVNSRKLHANLRGMKNKPGTVPPADITSLVDKTPRIANRLDITYSSGTDVHKKFGMQVALLRTHSVDTLVQRIKEGNHFAKESVLEKLRKPEDDDIEMASFDLTLKDPLSYMRITVPCRSVFCKHNQCWDAMAFLSINEQTPQWTCPICHIAISGLEGIAVDGYFQDILEKVDPEVDTILVDPQGNWRVPEADKTRSQPKSNTKDTPEPSHEVLDLGDTEDEDDTKSLALPKRVREASSTASIPSSTVQSAKRKAMPICIDLTEDSDDEAEPPKRVKHSESIDGNDVPPPRASLSEATRPQVPASVITPVPTPGRTTQPLPPATLSSWRNGNVSLSTGHAGQPDPVVPMAQPAFFPSAKDGDDKRPPDLLLVRSKSQPESHASLDSASRVIARTPSSSLLDNNGLRSQSVPLGRPNSSPMLNTVHQRPEDIFQDVPSALESPTLGGISIFREKAPCTPRNGDETESMQSPELPLDSVNRRIDASQPTSAMDSSDYAAEEVRTPLDVTESYHAYSDDFSDGGDY